MHVHPQAELAILFVDEAAMEELHEQWMDEPGPTDVLCFPMDELRPGADASRRRRGCSATSWCARRSRRARRRRRALRRGGVLLLTTHGILHLLGYDHAEPEEEKEMFALQRRLLLTFLAER